MTEEFFEDKWQDFEKEHMNDHWIEYAVREKASIKKAWNRRLRELDELREEKKKLMEEWKQRRQPELIEGVRRVINDSWPEVNERLNDRWTNLCKKQNNLEKRKKNQIKRWTSIIDEESWFISTYDKKNEHNNNYPYHYDVEQRCHDFFWNGDIEL